MSAAEVISLPVHDPPVGPACAQCGGERKLPKRLYRAEAELDPFCSSDCCRRWYGLPSEDHSEQRAKFRKRSYVR